MKYSIISEVIELGTGTGVKYQIPYVHVGTNAKRITKLKCFAVAQEKVKPFSIYPVEFMLESNDMNLMPLHVVAIPQPDIRILHKRVCENETYIVACDELLEIPCLGGERIYVYARPLLPHAVAPKAFFIIEYEDR